MNTITTFRRMVPWTWLPVGGLDQAWSGALRSGSGIAAGEASWTRLPWTWGRRPVGPHGPAIEERPKRAYNPSSGSDLPNHADRQG